MASISPICKKCKTFILTLKSPAYRDFMIKKSLKSKTSKSHTWAPLNPADQKKERKYIRINRKKYVNGSVNSEGHLKKFKTRRDAFSGLYLSIYVINAARVTVLLSYKEGLVKAETEEFEGNECNVSH